jgi:hypothetical protein
VSETYAADGGQDTAAGRVILMITSSLSAVLVIAGLVYAVGTGARHDAALATAGCEPGLSPSGLPCTTAQMLASQYTAIETPYTQQLNADAAAYAANEWHHLEAAETALTAEAASEHAFGASLAGIAFPPAIAPVARALARADEARASLTAEQARSSSLPLMRSFNRRVQAAGATAAADMRLIREALDSSHQAT